MASKLIIITTTAVVALAISILVPIDLSRFYSPQGTKDELILRSEALPIENAVGPESFAFDPLGGGPYTGVSDGRIIKWQHGERRWINFAVTSSRRDGCEGSHDHEPAEHACGRPLGLGFNNKTGQLYIADAYMGLLVVGSEGGLATTLATEAEGVPFRFTNGLDTDPATGAVYFTDSSANYERRKHLSAVVNRDRSGRLMKYDPGTKRVHVLVRNLTFPNGVALSQNGNFILVAESTTCQILRLWLNTSSEPAVPEVFAQLPGFPDNIKRNNKGQFWVGLYSRRERFWEWIVSYPWIRRELDKPRVQRALARWKRGGGLAVRLSEEGGILEIVEDKNGKVWKSISQLEEKDYGFWIGSITSPFAGFYEKRF